MKTLVSPKLHFNMCSLDSSVIKNADIQPDVKFAIPPLILYSSQFWADHFAHTRSGEPSDRKLKEGVKFVMHKKLLFWIETMSLLGKANEVSLILKRALSWKVCFQFISLQCLILAGQFLNPHDELTLFVLLHFCIHGSNLTICIHTKLQHLYEMEQHWQTITTITSTLV